MNKIMARKADSKGTYYVDYDNEIEAYGIFGTESGFCYETYCSEKEANDNLAKYVK